MYVRIGTFAAYRSRQSVFMKAILFISALIVTLNSQAQVISYFDWSSTPLTQAVTGPNATSVSTSATSQYVGGAVGYAINPGLPTKNVDLVIPGSPYFDVNGIEISFYFRREEAVASFFKRGSLFNFQMSNGQLMVNFTTTQGSTPGNLSINSGNVYNIPEDHLFHFYRFRYDNNTGIANIWVDGNVVYTYNGVAGRPLTWTNAGNVIIGENMDATSRNTAILGKLTVQNVSAAMLPLDLLGFTGEEKSGRSFLQWTTTNETNFSHFMIERSADAKNFTPLKTISASKGTTLVKKYSTYDESPLKGTNYYRLRMTDKDGSFTFSDIVKVNVATTSASSGCYPNPAASFVNVMLNNTEAGTFDYSVSTLQGNVLKAGVTTLGMGTQQVKIDLANTPSGVLIIRMHNRQTNSVETFRVVKG